MLQGSEIYAMYSNKVLLVILEIVVLMMENTFSSKNIRAKNVVTFYCLHSIINKLSVFVKF